MTIKDNERIHRIMRSVKATRSCPSMIVRLPIRLGGDRYSLAAVYPLDGKAVIRPSAGGLLVTDWAAFMRYVRRHGSC